MSKKNETIKSKFIEIFTTKKIVDLKFLNFFGLQILRYLFSKIINSISSFFFYNKKILHNYNNNGYLLINNFLDQHEYKKLKDEFEIIINTRGKNVYESANDNHKALNSSINYITYDYENNSNIEVKFPNIKKLYNNTKVNDLFRNAENKKDIHLLMRLERIKTKDNFKNDANAYWHVDTFHDTHKGWLYLTDVKEENGPFNYLAGSNNFSFTRLIWEYKNSIQFFLNKNLTPFFLNEKISKKFESKKIQFTCPENSFLIANTHGYHRRGDADPNQIRDGIAFYTRENPFKKF